MATSIIVATFLTLTSLVVPAYAAPDTPVTPVIVPPKVTCEITSTNVIEKPELYGLDKDGIKSGNQTGVSVTYPDLVLFRAYCYADKDVKIKTVTDIIKFPACNTTQNVCKYYERVEPDNLQLSTNRVLVAEYLVQNRSTEVYTIKPSDLVVRISPGTSEVPSRMFTPFTVSPKETPIYPQLQDFKCRVVVSGALDPIPENVENPEVRVTNGKLLFTATVTGLTGTAQVASTTWAGGPDANGMWDKAPLNVLSQVTATVKINNGQTKTCGIRIKPMGESFSIGMSRFGDCSVFGSQRSYYYLDKNNKGFQNGGYSPALQLVGLGVKYGENSADIPYRGVVNGAASLEGVINSGTGGAVVIPPVGVRKYSGAVVVARAFNAATQGIGGKPVAWGLLDYSNYSITQMQQLEQVSDDETVVFQVFLASTQIENGVDLRGGAAANSIPYYEFRPGTADNKPYDRIVPLMNASCGSITFPSPVRKDKAISPELADLKMCGFSKPYTLADFKASRVNLDVMHVTPENAMHRFPPELVKTAAKPACVAGAKTDGSPQVKCWNISASSIGINTDKEPFKQHSSCQTTKILTTTTTVTSPGGGYGTGGGGGGGTTTTVTTQTPVTVYSASCNVLEQNECGPSTAIRFSGYNQMMLAGLGCVAKYGKAGEQVTATLKDEGILPYTSFGGSAPMHWEKYGAKATTSGKAEDAKGYACIPCRFASDAAAAGTTLDKTTKVLPVDQDAKGDDPNSPGQAARKPIYSFTEGTAPKECVKNVAFEVRYFGSSACDGVNAPPGHFCSSSNIAVQNCSTTDGGVGPGAFGGGGNVAGSFKIPVCPGSGIETDSVSVSWSPIIVDVTGNGISVSREFHQAKVFDIRGDGRGRVIDWPYNNNEVAFLVRPNKGKVTSIKELFGDYKAQNGFEALRKLDSNKDGMVSKKDKAFAELGLWFDRNRNGKLDAGELESLEAHGVAELPLHYVKPNRKGVEGRTLSTVYFNHKHQRYMNIEDHYFYEYITNGRKMSQK